MQVIDSVREFLSKSDGRLVLFRLAELLDVIVRIARADRSILRQLEMQVGVEAPPQELIAATRQAIADATEFDERESNYNFDYDDQAYSTVKRNFRRLVELGHLRDAMELSLELISDGSYQGRIERRRLDDG